MYQTGPSKGRSKVFLCRVGPSHLPFLSMAKAPFERVLSLIEKKKLIRNLISAKAPILCKFSNGAVHQFFPRKVSTEGHIDGFFEDKEPTKTALAGLTTAMFYCQSDRYFLNTKVVRVLGNWRLQSGPDFYKLNRRESYRVSIPLNISVFFHVTLLNTKLCSIKARMSEFSAGGAKLRWPAKGPLPKGTILTGNLLWFRGKSVPISAQVVHASKSGHYGIKFIGVDAVDANRLKLMSVELQQMLSFV